MKNKLRRTIVTGAVIGGFAGAITGIFDELGLLLIRRFTPIPSPIITGTALGAIIGGGIGAVTALYTPQTTHNNNPVIKQSLEQNYNDTDQKVTMKIREEQLDIAKRLIQTGEVEVHKEVLKEEKTLTVPVMREELVIERKILNGEATDKARKLTEVVRIPLKEERIEIVKTPEVLNKVSVAQRKFQKTKRIEAKLKKEKVHLEVAGTPKIIDRDL